MKRTFEIWLIALVWFCGWARGQDLAGSLNILDSTTTIRLKGLGTVTCKAFVPGATEGSALEPGAVSVEIRSAKGGLLKCSFADSADNEKELNVKAAVVRDLNFDGNPDIVIWWMLNWSSDIVHVYLFDPLTKRFVRPRIEPPPEQLFGLMKVDESKKIISFDGSSSGPATVYCDSATYLTNGLNFYLINRDELWTQHIVTTDTIGMEWNKFEYLKRDTGWELARHCNFNEYYSDAKSGPPIRCSYTISSLKTGVMQEQVLQDTLISEYIIGPPWEKK